MRPAPSQRLMEPRREQKMTLVMGRRHVTCLAQVCKNAYSASSNTRSSLDREGCRSLRSAFASI